LYNLVLVDDEAEIRNGLMQYFPWKQLGYKVTGVFDNGRKALDYMANHTVDVLLCDVMMPELTGLDVARTLYEQGSSIKILFLSGHKDFEYAKQALAYNVSAYIVKPTDFEELHETFSKLKLELDKSASTQRNGAPIAEDISYPEKIIGVIRHYVEVNCATAGLEQAAELVKLSPDYLSKYIKRQTGRNFSDLVVEARMQQAALLLRDIQFKTFEISEMVGYKHPKNFTRTFRQYYGVSPRQFRNHATGEVSKETDTTDVIEEP